METLFTWIHLSDLQLGGGDADEAAEQRLVLAAMRDDIARFLGRERLRPDAIFVTGDVAWSGEPEQYAEARVWLAEVAKAAGVEASRIWVVPGNHDVDSTLADRDAARLVRALREGNESIDDALANDRHHLVRRQQPYLDFAKTLAPACAALFWADDVDARGGLRLRLVGLDTALLSSDREGDRGNLRLGRAQLAEAVLGGREGDLVVVLSHHPFSGGWLADEVEADRWIRRGAHLHLFGHAKDAESVRARTGAGGDFVRIAGHAVRGRAGGDQGYSVGAVNRAADGALVVRVWPRRWSDRNKDLRDDVDHLAEGARFTDHVLRLRTAAPPVSVSVPDSEVSIARLPATSAKLFGREAELAWLEACWKDGVHVATIVAWGGVGKSALVNAWLAKVRDDGWRGAKRVYGWSFYTQGTGRLGSSDEFFAEALKWFGDEDSPPTSPWDKGERLAELVRQERTLLVLDGLEPLQWGPGVQPGKLKDPALEAMVKELGAQNTGLCLITSRIAVTDLDGLGGDKVRTLDLTHLSPEASAELLRARGAKGTDEELREAAKEYKGHGLALTLLGSYLEDVAGGDIRCRKEIGPLEQDERQGGHARRVMMAYEGWLGAPELSILHMIGFFDRPAAEDEMAALRAEPLIPGLTDALARVNGAAWNKAVAKLRRASLLLAEQDRRLDAHPLVREHFGEQFKQAHPEAWREGHTRLYEHLRRTAKELPETIEEMAPLHAAVVHGCLAGKNQEALDEVWWKRVYRHNEHFHWKRLGAFCSEVAVLSAFFDPPWERLAPGLSERAQAFVLNQAGLALRALGRLSEATALLQLSLTRDIAQEDWENAAWAASNLSELRQARGELQDALADAMKSVELADRSGDALWRIARRSRLAAVLHAMGRRDEAAAQFEEADRIEQEKRPDGALLHWLPSFRRCDILLDLGRDAEVRERAGRTLAWFLEHGGLLDIALDRVTLGRAHLLVAQRRAEGDVSEDLSQATSYLEQADDGLRRAGHQEFLPLGLLARAALRTHTGDFAAARRDLTESLAISTRYGFRLHEADTHLAYARLALAESTSPIAREHLTRARAIIAETGYHRRDAELADLEAASR